MRKSFTAFARISPYLMVAAACLSAPRLAHAGKAGEVLEERYHAALSHVAQEVKGAPDPAEKRRILAGFFQHMEEGLQKAETLSSLPEGDRQSLHTVLGKYLAYQAELDGSRGFARVEDRELDEFAAYVRQDMEQAPVGGGVYISAGALIVILLVLLLIT
ncbi:MAG: hypothetical protein JF616_09905 [Fibrobacteres bacterium]|jgi:hypothetical protein|nr:hypothetical protein [Fibrobacterota bacterium]